MAIDTGVRPPPSEDGHGATVPTTRGAVAATPGGGRGSRASRRATALVGIAIVLMAGMVRFAGLGHPPRIYFDETYYANDANEFLQQGVERDFAVHPPVGKWGIAAGIATFGFNSFGWRAGAAAAGTLTVAMVYLAGLRLFRRRGIAALAALLLAVDGVAFTLSRIAMLDVFLMLFVTAGFWLLLVDRDRQWAGIEQRPATTGVPLPRRPHLYRWLAGVAFGLAIATKWSALLAIGAAGLFVLVSELLWRRRITGTPWVGLGRIVASGLLCLVVVPLAVYLASYVPWFANFADTRPGEDRCDGATCDVSFPEMAGAWFGEQREIASFHGNLRATHPYRAAAYTWPILGRPVAFYWESCDREQEAAGECDVAVGNVGAIVHQGNPAVWWPALLSYLVLAVVGVMRRDWRAGAIGLFLGVQFFPWLAAPRPLFLFYTAPIIPFIVLSLTYLAAVSRDRRWLGWVPAAVALLAVAGFLFWYPVFSGQELARSAWRFRMWFSSWI